MEPVRCWGSTTDYTYASQIYNLVETISVDSAIVGELSYSAADQITYWETSQAIKRISATNRMVNLHQVPSMSRCLNRSFDCG